MNSSNLKNKKIVKKDLKSPSTMIYNKYIRNEK
jgi:hypothetical protein